jgi:competence protein ComEC
LLRTGTAVGSQLRPDLVIVRATVTALSSPRTVRGLRSPVLLRVVRGSPGWLGLEPSQRLVVSGKLAPPLPSDDLTAVLSVRGAPELVGKPSAVQRAAGVVRGGLRAAVSGHSADVQGLLPGLVLGDVSRMDPQLTADFRTAGLTHLVAVSGANVAIVFAVVLALARLVHVPPRSSLVLAALVLVGFVILVRPTPSVLRAAVMAAFLVLAALTGRLRQALSALLASVLVLMLVDPELSRSPGFALSTAATAALLVLSPRWAVSFRRRLPKRLADSLAVALAAQLACGPLIAVLSGQLSLVSVPANLLAEPAVPFATVFGVLSAVSAPVAMPVARVLADVAAMPTWWLAMVARRSASLPHATLAWQQNAEGGLMLAALTVLLVAAVRRPLWRRALTAACAGVVAVTATSTLFTGPWASPTWAFIACDVGQGDGLVLHAGPGQYVVVDTGPDPVKMQLCLDRLHVHHIALVVLSHLHADHVEGLPGVLAGHRVDAIDVGPFAEPAGEWARVQRWAADARVPISHLNAGDSFAIGNLYADVIAPLSLLHNTDSDPNNNSLVIRATLPSLSFLLTADVERVAQQALLGSDARLDADVLKVPHHGSNNQDFALLAATGAVAAVTSVGADNTYGQPAPITMAAISANGMRGYRTDKDGSVEVDVSGGRLVVIGHRGSGTPPAPGTTSTRRTAAARPSAGAAYRPPKLQRQHPALAGAPVVGLAVARSATNLRPAAHGMLRTWLVQALRSLPPPSCSATRSCSSPGRSPPPSRLCGRRTPRPTSATSPAPTSTRVTCST